jgi:tripartite-type tricarboxylate transporter receptor subunit TctC
MSYLDRFAADRWGAHAQDHAQHRAMRAVGRRGALALLGSAAAARWAAAAPALDYPARIVVGSAPGGGSDTVARLLAEQLRGGYAPQVTVENRPGASTRLGVDAVKTAAPDGATILHTPMPVMSLFPHVFPKTTRYDALVDFIPAATIGEIPYGWAVRADHPARDLRGFIEWARGRGGATFAPPVPGAPQHMLALTLAREAGINLTVVSYRGGMFAMQDLLGGRIDAFMSHMGDTAPTARAGQTRLLAVTSERRLPSMPEVGTFAEAGFPGLTADEAFCVLLPARTPAATVSALHRAVEAAVASAAVRDGLARLEMTPMVLSPAATAERIRMERERWGPIVRANGFSADD